MERVLINCHRSSLVVDYKALVRTTPVKNEALRDRARSCDHIPALKGNFKLAIILKTQHQLRVASLADAGQHRHLARKQRVASTTKVMKRHRLVPPARRHCLLSRG